MQKIDYNNIPLLPLDKIEDGDLLFLSGKKFLAKRIQWFQKVRFGKNSLYKINHVESCIWDKDKNLLTFGQDNPGRFQCSLFSEEYLNEVANGDEDVYIGKPKNKLGENALSKLRYDMANLAGSDCVLNYSYKSFLGFMSAAISYKLFKKEIWITGQPEKGSTCSQIMAKFYQHNFFMFSTKAWWHWFPSEMAEDDYIMLYKLDKDSLNK